MAWDRCELPVVRNTRVRRPTEKAASSELPILASAASPAWVRDELRFPETCARALHPLHVGRKGLASPDFGCWKRAQRGAD